MNFQEVGAQIVAVAHQVLEGHAFGIEKRHAAGFFDGLFLVLVVRFQALHFRQNRLDGGILVGQHAVEPPQDGHGDDHVPVAFGRIGPAQLVGDVGDQLRF